MRIRNAVRALAALGLAVLVAGCSETVYQKGGPFDRAPVETKMLVVAGLAGVCAPKAAEYYLLAGAITPEGDRAIRQAALSAIELAELSIGARAEYLAAKAGAGLLPADGSAAALAGRAAITVGGFAVVLQAAEARLAAAVRRIDAVKQRADPERGKPTAGDVIGAVAGGVASVAIYASCRAEVFARLDALDAAGGDPSPADLALLAEMIGGLKARVADG